jgi:hypothetical protein
MSTIVPSTHRISINYSRSLLLHLKPLLSSVVDSLYEKFISIMLIKENQEVEEFEDIKGIIF